MKLIIFVLIIFIFGLVGFEIKRKYIEQKQFLLYLKEFIDYAYLNISIYKNDINKIINNYLIQQKNKNAKYNKIFQINKNLSDFNLELINNYIYDKDLISHINLFFCNIGKADVENECVKLISERKYIDEQIMISNDKIKNKGDLYFKISLAIGVVIVIILW